MKIIVHLLLCAMLLHAAIAISQTIKRKHAKLNELPPKEILVELPTQGNRLKYLEQVKKQNAAQEVRNDADSVIKKMVADFNDHFTYCPVYFFYDTATLHVEERKFAGILLDKNLQPVKGIPIDTEDSTYFIVYYGIEAQNTGTAAEKKNDIYSGSYSNSNLPTLVAMDYKFIQLQNPLPYKIKMNEVNHGDLMKNGLLPYVYGSKHYNISYKPLALFYSETLKNFYNPMKVIRKYKK